LRPHGLSDALQAALSEAADALPSGGPEPRPTQPLESYLNALPRVPLTGIIELDTHSD